MNIADMAIQMSNFDNFDSDQKSSKFDGTSSVLYPVLAVHRDCLFDIGAWKQKHKSNAIRIKGPPSGRVMGQSR